MVWTPLLLVSAFLGVAIPLILSGTLTGRWGEDQLNFHEPAIRTFASELPRPNVRDYLSATTPGYHLAVAAASKLVGDSTASLRCVGALFTVALLALLGAACARAASPRGAAIAVTIPFLCSMYVVQSGVWLLPDNAGWLGVLGMLVMALRFRADASTLIGAGAVLVALVLVRQIHVWTAGLVWLSAWLTVSSPHAEESHPLSLSPLVHDVRRRGRPTIAAALATLPAAAVLLYFRHLWGGLTPPSFQGQYKGMNPAAPAFILSVFGAAGVFFAGFTGKALIEMFTRHRVVAAGAGLIGAVVSIVPETSYSVAEGRYSGLWALAGRLPLLAGRTAPALVALSVLGAVMVAAWMLTLRFRERWLLLAAMLGFMAAQAASFQLWQRYSEPFVLMVLALMAARTAPAAGPRGRLLRLVGPLVLAGLLAVLAIMTMHQAPPSVRWDHGAEHPRPGP